VLFMMSSWADRIVPFEAVNGARGRGKGFVLRFGYRNTAGRARVDA